MMFSPLISIIVPVYKVESYLRTCVDSVFKQTYNNWELLLVDNASPDSCPQICDSFAKEDKRIKVFHLSENKGVSSGRNKGVDEARGEYITFLDADDILHPSFLKTMLSLCIDNNADMSQCSSVRGSNYLFSSDIKKYTTRTYNNHSVFISETTKIVVWGKLYHNSIVKGVYFPYGKFYEDDHTTWKYYYNAKKIVVTTQPLYYYYINTESTMVQLTKKPSLSFVEAYNNRINYFREQEQKDLVACSDLQLCKALTLTYANPLITEQQKIDLKKRFKEAWEEIKYSKYIKLKYKILFGWFSICPSVASKVASKLR